MGLNVDGVNDNMGKHKGLSDKLGELALWLVDMVELAIKNNRVWWVSWYIVLSVQKHFKRWRELERLYDAYGKAIPMSTKAHGTRSVDNTSLVMKIVLGNYKVLLGHFMKQEQE